MSVFETVLESRILRQSRVFCKNGRVRPDTEEINPGQGYRDALFTDPLITRSSKHIFMYRSTPISDAILTIPIVDLYGPMRQISQAHGRNIVKFDLTGLGEKILEKELQLKNKELEMRRVFWEAEDDGGKKSRSTRRN
ncbi:hypothetical protein DFH27DRAFT_654932 [Peziza echinospora]|nr:hypothetical protein DFH27DRAFT_654932 [Peziza echinospora]